MPPQIIGHPEREMVDDYRHDDSCAVVAGMWESCSPFIIARQPSSGGSTLIARMTRFSAGATSRTWRGHGSGATAGIVVSPATSTDAACHTLRGARTTTPVPGTTEEEVQEVVKANSWPGLGAPPALPGQSFRIRMAGGTRAADHPGTAAIRLARQRVAGNSSATRVGFLGRRAGADARGDQVPCPSAGDHPQRDSHDQGHDGERRHLPAHHPSHLTGHEADGLSDRQVSPPAAFRGVAS